MAIYEMGIERVDEPGIGTLFARIRLRLAKELHPVYEAFDARRDAILAYRALWEPLSRNTRRRPVLLEAKQYLQVVAQEGPLLKALGEFMECDRKPMRSFAEFYRTSAQQPLAILQCMHVLNNPAAYPKWDCEKQLPQNSLHDRWERLLFMTHLFNFDDMQSMSN
jgi:hypothetical protein